MQTPGRGSVHVQMSDDEGELDRLLRGELPPVSLNDLPGARRTAGQTSEGDTAASTDPLGPTPQGQGVGQSIPQGAGVQGGVGPLETQENLETNTDSATVDPDLQPPGPSRTKAKQRSRKSVTAAEPAPTTTSPSAASTPKIRPSPKGLDGEILPKHQKYESRIKVVDAHQYSGHMASAPEWVDRNWIGWGDEDQLRNIPAGPCLRVPTPAGEIALCRIGDYVARQEVTMLRSSASDPERGAIIDERIEVWPREQFEKLFIPS